MKITLSPIAAQADTQASVSNDILTIDGIAYDFSALAEAEIHEPGDEAPFAGPVQRVDGQVQCILLYRYDSRTALAVQPEDAAHYVQDITSGALTDPILRR